MGLRNFAEIFSVLGGGLLVITPGARLTMFVAGLLPCLAGLASLAGLAIHAKTRASSDMPAPAPAEAS